MGKKNPTHLVSEVLQAAGVCENKGDTYRRRRVGFLLSPNSGILPSARCCGERAPSADCVIYSHGVPSTKPFGSQACGVWPKATPSWLRVPGRLVAPVQLGGALPGKPRTRSLCSYHLLLSPHPGDKTESSVFLVFEKSHFASVSGREL